MLAEIGGGFGDIGLLAPLAVALITLNHLNATAVLAGAGIFYIVTALVFRLPVPVQPLKAVSAIAIASGLGPPGIAAAGLMIGVIFVALSVTGLTSVLRRIFVPPVVRGIQLSIGLLLAQAAIGLMTRQHQLRLGAGPLDGLGVTYPVLIGASVLLLLLVFQRRALPGGSLLLLGLGTVLGVAVGVHPRLHLSLGPAPVAWHLPTGADFGRSFWVLVVPQVGLSIGNSVIATSATARRYFGQAGARVSARKLALSMGVANLVVSPFGGMPMCHGAGGMTAHFKTGARTGLGIAVYGGCLVALGLVLGASAPVVLALIPVAVLAGFLLYVGIEHAALVSDLRSQHGFLVAGAVAAVSVATGNISAGVVVGLTLYWLLKRFSVRPAAAPEAVRAGP
jgi:MFS superfamily sulfate permease-like transporter